MLGSSSLVGSSLSLRPAAPADEAFLARLHRSTRPDLEQLPLPPPLLDALMAQQYQALIQGAGHAYASAMHCVIERAGERAGALIVDIGANEVRLVYLALLPVLRGQGYGAEILRGLQQAAAQARAPLAATVWHTNPRARALYLRMGFVVDAAEPGIERLVWYPEARPMVMLP